MFYTYVWLREDRTPYYVGKGSGYRAYNRHRVGNAPPLGRIVFYIAKNESDAFGTEIALIWYYGRKDIGTGCLRNLTDGGEGARHLFTEEQKANLSRIRKEQGTIPPNWAGKKQSKDHIRKRIESRLAKGNYATSEDSRRIISEATKLAMARPDVKLKLGHSKGKPWTVARLEAQRRRQNEQSICTT
jgi:hypothetical protein